MAHHRAFLKWAGSKYNCLNKLLPLLPKGHRLIEPFGGSGVIFMNTAYPVYIFGETNPDLINIFHTIQAQGESFIEYCQTYFKNQYNVQEAYQELRSLFNGLNPCEQKSALFLYLNRHGYNGLCRYNSKGMFNVPFGRYSRPYFPQNEMRFFHQNCQKVQFIYSDFRHTFTMAEKGDVIYCDPPYVPFRDSTQVFSYTGNKFTTEDQIELAELAQETASKGIPVLISNHDTDFTREHYRHTKIISFPVARLINCKTNQRQAVNELVALFKK